MREIVALDGLEAMLDEQQRRRALDLPDEPDAYLAPRWSTPGRLIGLAALELGHRHESVPGVSAMLGAVAAAFEIKASLSSMHADLLEGRPTYPIAVIAKAAGLSLQPWPNPTLVRRCCMSP